MVNTVLLCHAKRSRHSYVLTATEERNEPLYSIYSSGYVMLNHDLDAEFNTPPQIKDRGE